MSSAENKKFRPIVDDSATAVPIDLFTQDDVDYIPLSTLYERSCAKAKTKVNPVVLKQLPTTPRHHYRLMVLDCSGTYIGNEGIIALAPVIAACIRMTHLLLPRVGLKASGALTLLKVLAVHPGITDINLSQNDLGTTVGKELLKVAIAHQRISTLNLHETLIIQPIKRKIEVQIEKNYAIRESFSVPLIPSHPDDEDVKQAKRREEEERARAEREEQLRKELAERIPTWAPMVMAQLVDVLFKYRENMENVHILFASSEVGDANANVHNRFVSPKTFIRAMKISGVRGFEDNDGEVRATEFAELFFAWQRSDNTIDYTAVIDALRVHATFNNSGNLVKGIVPRQFIDRLYDAKDTLLKSFESIDIDETKTISGFELLVGVQSITGNVYAEDVAKSLVGSVVASLEQPPLSSGSNKEGASGDDGSATADAAVLKTSSSSKQQNSSSETFEAQLIDTKINYVDDFILRLKMPNEPVVPPVKDWMLKRSDFKALVVVEEKQE